MSAKEKKRGFRAKLARFLKRRRKRWRARWRRFRAIPHLFAKLTILYCIVCATAASAFSLVKQAEGMGMAEVLAIVLGFFGGELLLLCLKTVLKKNKEEDENDENSFDEQGV